MLRALGIVTDNIDSGSAWRGKKEEMKHEE